MILTLEQVLRCKGGVIMSIVQKIQNSTSNAINQDTVKKISKHMISDDKLSNLAEFFKVFGDFTRIKIICALLESELCVCELAALLGVTQSAISHQLKVLKGERLVRFRREGKVVYYSLDDDHIKDIFDQGLNHITE